MKHLHYLLRSTTDATTCPLLVVAVGTSKAENPEREIYRVTPRQAIRFIENRAIADYVKNLSLAFRALESMTKRKTHNNERR